MGQLPVAHGKFPVAHRKHLVAHGKLPEEKLQISYQIMVSFCKISVRFWYITKVYGKNYGFGTGSDGKLPVSSRPRSP